MIELTSEQKQTLVAFLECFDLYVTGQWPSVKAGMINDFGIMDPEGDLEEVRELLING